MNKEIKCPYCGDTWKYLLSVDYETGKALVTYNFDIIEDWQECSCYKCGGKYHVLIDSDSDLKMVPEIYRAWRTVGK